MSNQYQVIHKYQNDVVYFDTDSVILLLDEATEPPNTSTVLGGEDTWKPNSLVKNDFYNLQV